MSEPILLPCPWCGKQPHVRTRITTPNFVSLRYSCACLEVAKPPEEWNTRADQSEVERLRAEVGELQRVVAEYKEQTGCPICRRSGSERDTLKARNAELAKALEDFLSGYYINDYAPDEREVGSVDHGQARKLRQALAKTGGAL